MEWGIGARMKRQMNEAFTVFRMSSTDRLRQEYKGLSRTTHTRIIGHSPQVAI
jgi:hypothetical protein